MAQPSIRTSRTAGQTQENKHYQSIDNVDEDLYNGLGTIYEKAAFIDAVETRLAEITVGTGAAFTDGNSVANLWNSRRTYLKKKWKKKARKHRPADNADPPVVGGGQQQEQAQAPPAQPTQPGPAIPPAPAGPADAVADGAAEGQRGPSPRTSPSTLAPGSPLYVFTNDPGAPSDQVLLSPTRGERAHVRDDTQDQNWKFVSVLFQTAIFDGDRAADDNRADMALHPRKSVGLYVRPDASGFIVDQLVAKCTDISEGNDWKYPEAEIQTNKLLHRTKCSHLLRYRGDGVRTTKKRALPESEKRPEEQRVLYLYTEFAQDLEVHSLIAAHADENVPIPEHFIWYFLSQMVEGLSALQEGKCKDPHAHEPLTRRPTQVAEVAVDLDSEDPVADNNAWKPLIHSDIKSANVFCASGNVKYPLWPRVILADFDITQPADNIRRRYAGTRGWQPPERNAFGKNTTNYDPAKWEISVKSDIWAVGLIAYRMLHTGQGEDACRGIKEGILQQAQEKWLADFITGKRSLASKKARSIISNDLQEVPSMYSIKLGRLIQRCLRYDPDSRPDLQDLRFEVDPELARLDRLYGELYRTDVNELDDGHKILRSEDIRHFDQFAIGQRYNPPRKRRRISTTEEQDAEYRAVATDWADEMAYPRPDPDAQAGLIAAMEELVKSSYDYELLELRDNKSLHHCFQYLLSCLKARITPDAPIVHVTKWEGEKGLEDAFKTHAFRRGVLQRLGDVIVPELLGDEKHVDIRDAITALGHFVRWAILLLDMDGEPGQPYMVGKTELHRGFRDWIFIHPYPNATGYTGFAYLDNAAE